MKSSYILIAVMVIFSVTLMAQENDGNNQPKGMFLKAREIQRSKNFLKNPGNTDVTELYSEDFESGGATWTATGSWQIGAPTSGPMSGYNSTNCAATNLSGNYGDYEDSWLLSQAITLPGSSQQILLSFYEWFSLESGYDYGRVQISTDNGNSWAQLYASNGYSEWRSTFLDITTYQGQTIMLGFNLTTDGSIVADGWYVDDIKIERMTNEPLEATITSFDSQNFPLIYMNVAVDTFGVGMPTLTQSNFAVYENEVLQTNLFQVTPPEQGGGQRLADIVFLVDNSGSMGEEQTAILNNMVAFINQLIQSNIDYALGLCRFGQTAKNGNPFLEDNGILTLDAIYFRDNVLLRNIASGSVEPGYWAIDSSASGFTYRPGAQKIFIILTDETPDQGGATQQDAINACLNGSITLYALTNEESAGLNTVATQTNGRYYNITDPFNDILDDIGGNIINTYIVRYSSNDQNCNGLSRNVKVVVTYNAYQDTATRLYVPCQSPTIQRTPATIALHQQSWIEGTEFTIEVEVTDDFEPYVNLVRLFYKNTPLTDYSSVNMTNTTGNLWSGIIPGGSTLTPGVDYFITASDGLITVSAPAINPSTNPYQLAILPNQAPVIIHTPIEFYDVGLAIDIFAQISDNTNSLANQKLFYRMRGQILYESVTMQLLSGNNYQAAIPSGFATIDGIDYYISAWDNFGVRTDHGSETDPHLIEALQDLVVTPDNHNVGWRLGTVAFDISTLQDWWVTDNADWLNISPISGSGNGTIQVTYLENSLNAQRIGSITVSTDPQPWLHWDDGTVVNAMTVNGTNTFSVAARFTPAELTPYTGRSLTKIAFYPTELGVNYVLNVWTGLNESSLFLDREQQVTGYIIDQWNEIMLASPLLLDTNEELWIGYTVTYPTGTYPAATDDGPAITGFGDKIKLTTTWLNLADYGFSYNWSIGGYVDVVKGNHQLEQEFLADEIQKASNDETQEVQIIKSNSFLPANINNTFNYSSSNAGRASKTVTVTQGPKNIPVPDIISLYAGWNLISFDVAHNPDSTGLVFAPLIADNNLITVTSYQNQQGVFYLPPPAPPFLNTLQHIVDGDGYWIKVQNATTLSVEGIPIPSTLSIDLHAGWNLISYWPLETTTPELAFEPLISSGILEMVTSYEQGGKIFNPYGPIFLNTLTEIKNGFGYWVKVSADYSGFEY